MRPVLQRCAVALATVVLAACSAVPAALPNLAPAGRPAAQDAAAPDAPAPVAMGRLRLAIRWPEGPGRDLAGYHAQLVPDSTATLKVIVKKGATTVTSVDVNRPSGQAVTNTTISLHVDTGLTVLVEAYPSGANSGTKIAEASQANVEIKSSADTSLTVTLGSLYTPAIGGVSDSDPSRGESFTISGTGFTPAWRASGPTVKFSTSGASASITPSSITDTSLTVTVPSSAVAGGITVVTDGVESGTQQMTFSSGVSTFAGSSSGYQDDTGTAAKFGNPGGIAFGPTGDLVVADLGNHAIRSVTTGGVVTTIAGNGTAAYVDDSGTNARFNRPFDVAVDSAGTIYVADVDNNAVRKIVGTTVSTLAGDGSAGDADGIGTAARFRAPVALELDSTEQNLYVAEYYGHRIRKIELSSGTVTRFAGTGAAGYLDGADPLQAQFNGPHGLSFDGSGNLFVAEYVGSRIRKIASNGAVSTLVSAGTIAGPLHLGYHNGSLYVAEYDSHGLWKVVVSTGAATKIFGGVAGSTDGALDVAKTSLPMGIALKTPLRVYMTDVSFRVRIVKP